MDPITGFLEGPRAREAFLLKVVLEPPWSLLIQDEAPLAVVAITHGSASLDHPSLEAGPVELRAGDLAIIRGPDHYVIADRAGTEPTIAVDPIGRCRSLDGTDVADRMTMGVRTWGNRVEGSDVMLVGTYRSGGEVGRWLLDALPAVLVLRAGEWEDAAVRLLGAEIAREEPGQQVVLDRALDLVLVSAVRAAFAAGTVGAPPWFRARGDEVVAEALSLMHGEPSAPWTVESLAGEVGVSRAAFARRFNEAVGEPPMAFLTSWRMALAADLLVVPGATVTSVARDVGYGSPFTFSTAFKRTYGESPRHYRDTVGAGPHP